MLDLCLADFFNQKYCEFSRPEVSFTATIEDLHKENTRLGCEVSEWKDKAARETEIIRVAEDEVSQLKATIQLIQKDNEKLEMCVQEWKSVAEKFNSSASRYGEEMRKVFQVLEEVKSELC